MNFLKVYQSFVSLGEGAICSRALNRPTRSKITRLCRIRRRKYRSIKSRVEWSSTSPVITRTRPTRLGRMSWIPATTSSGGSDELLRSSKTASKSSKLTIANACCPSAATSPRHPRFLIRTPRSSRATGSPSIRSTFRSLEPVFMIGTIADSTAGSNLVAAGHPRRACRDYSFSNQIRKVMEDGRELDHGLPLVQMKCVTNRKNQKKNPEITNQQPLLP